MQNQDFTDISSAYVLATCRCLGPLLGLSPGLLSFAGIHFHNFAYSVALTSLSGGRGTWEVPLQTIKLFGAAEILMLTAGVLLITALTFLL